MIRELTEEDFEVYLALLGQMTKVIAYEKAIFLQTLQEIKLNSYICVLTLEGRVIGTGKVLHERKLFSPSSFVSHIEDIIVDKPYRGRGFGREIVRHLIEKAKALGSYKVILSCSEATVPFYEKCGMIRRANEMCQYL